MNTYQSAPPLWAEGAVAAGFPSPAEDHGEPALTLDGRFIRHPAATFIVQAAGESLRDAGILSGDYLVVDRSHPPGDGDVVIAVIDGAFTAKRLRLGARRGAGQGQPMLEAANPAFAPIPLPEDGEIWGVVTSVHRDLLA